MRHSLKLGDGDLSEARLQSLWKALDEDASGYIDAGEFGRFMKLAVHGSGTDRSNSISFRSIEAHDANSRLALEQRSQRGNARVARQSREHKASDYAAAKHLAGLADWYDAEAARLEAGIESELGRGDRAPSCRLRALPSFKPREREMRQWRTGYVGMGEACLYDDVTRGL